MRTSKNTKIQYFSEALFYLDISKILKLDKKSRRYLSLKFYYRLSRAFLTKFWLSCNFKTYFNFWSFFKELDIYIVLLTTSKSYNFIQW